jgi:uncharacterized protein YbaP (TraB family)
MRLTVSGGRRRIGMTRLSRTSEYRTIPARWSGWLRLLVTALALGLVAPAAAQVEPAHAQAAAADPDAVLVEELVVTAREPGPAFWKVQTPTSTVYVLGVPSVAPKRMAWDQTGFLRRLQGANAVILPAKGMRVRLFGAPRAMFAYLRLKAGPFEDALPTDRRARFVAARTALGQPAKRYGTHNPLAAALLMITDYRERWSLTDSDPAKLIRYLAGQAKVPVVSKSYDLAPLLDALTHVPADAGQVCLDEVLDAVEAGPSPTLAATRAWAQGDVRGALAQEHAYERCLNEAPGAAAFDARVKADEAAQIAQALKTPGHALAVVPLRTLLSRGGVLDRLRGQGLQVMTPGDEE